MSRVVLLCWISAAISGALLASNTSFGQNRNAAGMLYSRGVHAYFSGRDSEAEPFLTHAIQSDPQDPRPYYFRAMCRLHQGRDAEARQDMQAGAAVEARAPNRWAVGSALQRVQGRDRLLLEGYRRQARLDEAIRRDERNRTRYEQIIRRESDVLRQAVEVPLDKLVQPADPQELINSQVDPSPHAKLPSDPPPQRQETSPLAPPVVDPFADDAVQPVEADATSVPDGPPAAIEPAAGDDAGDDILFATPDDESKPAEAPQGNESSDDFDDADPFGDI